MRGLLPIACLLGALALHSTAGLAGQQDFKLLNRTGYQIDEVYVSRASSRSWGEDVMGKDALDNGESVTINFTAPANVCKWDMKVKYNDGDEATWKALDLCNISKVSLFWDRKNEVTRAVTE